MVASSRDRKVLCFVRKIILMHAHCLSASHFHGNGGFQRMPRRCESKNRSILGTPLSGSYTTQNTEYPEETYHVTIHYIIALQFPLARAAGTAAVG